MVKKLYYEYVYLLGEVRKMTSPSPASAASDTVLRGTQVSLDLYLTFMQYKELVEAARARLVELPDHPDASRGHASVHQGADHAPMVSLSATNLHCSATARLSAHQLTCPAGQTPRVCSTVR